MRIGELRERVTILRESKTRDAIGGNAVTEATVMTAWAKVEVPKSTDGVLAMSDTEVRTHEVTLRYSDVPQLGDIVVWRGWRLRVKNVRPELPRWCVLECVSDGRS